jgi:hypothetical protein
MLLKTLFTPVSELVAPKPNKKIKESNLLGMKEYDLFYTEMVKNLAAKSNAFKVSPDRATLIGPIQTKSENTRLSILRVSFTVFIGKWMANKVNQKMLEKTIVSTSSGYTGLSVKDVYIYNANQKTFDVISISAAVQALLLVIAYDFDPNLSI